MSYCRFGDDSDVYVIQTGSDSYECCGCFLMRMGLIPVVSTFNLKGIIHHLETDHKDDLVPAYALKSLKEENEYLW